MTFAYRNANLTVFALYFFCFFCRLLDYFILRTDQTFWNEAFIHKLAGIAVLALALKYCQLSWQGIGFAKTDILRNSCCGLCFAALVFIFAYSIEIWLLLSQGRFSGLDIYVSGFGFDKNLGKESGILFFLICMIGNIINVIMEEGIFRGLFQKLFERRYSFITAAVFSALLFGLWHIVGPIRNFFDGEVNAAGMIVNAALLAAVSALVGFRYSLMAKLTDSLYMGMADHFFNNTIINVLYVRSAGGSDELLFIRIGAAQILSFSLVLICYLANKHRKTS